MSKVIEVPGIGNVEFPDTMTDADIGAAIRKQLGTQRTSGQAVVGKISPGDVLRQVPGVLKDIGRAALNTAPGAETGMEDPAVALLSAAIPGGARTAGMGLAAAAKSSPAIEAIQKVIRKLPSTVRAGATLQKVMDAAKNVPVDLTKADAIVARAKQLEARGSSPMPRVMKKYVESQKTVTAKFGGQKVQMQPQPMTYEVGRDFASNAGAQSVKEMTGMNAPMKAQVKQFAKALSEANREAAVKAGMGDLYDQGIKQYRQAKSLQAKTAIIKRYSIRAALLAGGAGLSAKLIRDLIEP